MTRSPFPSDEPLRRLYDDLWRDGREALAAGTPHVDPLPVAGGPRWGVSAVLRPRTWSAALARCAADVAESIGAAAPGAAGGSAGGFVYPAGDLHVTLRQFETYRARVASDDVALGRYAEALRALARETAPLALTLRGLTASAGGVLVQGWPHFDLQALRTRLQQILEAQGTPTSGPETSRTTLRTSAHATLAIFPARIARTDALVETIDAHRATPFATEGHDALWLVGYARTATSVRLIAYGRFPLVA